MLNFKQIYDTQKIKSILKNNNIDDDIKNIEYLNLNKIIVYLNSNKQILKIYIDNSSVKLGKNELTGYNLINSNYQKFILPKYECVLNHDDLFIAKIEYLGEKKDYNQFINKKLKSNIYLNSIAKKKFANYS